MTMERLRQLDSLIDEQRDEEERLAREARHIERMEKEYGVGCLLGYEQMEQSRARMRELTERRRAEAEAVRAWVEQIRDAQVRRAFKLRYLDGLPWSTVARRMGYANDSGPRMLCARHLASERGAG